MPLIPHDPEGWSPFFRNAPAFIEANKSIGLSIISLVGFLVTGMAIPYRSIKPLTIGTTLSILGLAGLLYITPQMGAFIGVVFLLAPFCVIFGRYLSLNFTEPPAIPIKKKRK